MNNTFHFKSCDIVPFFTVLRAFGIPQIIYISLVYIIGTNIETKEKKCRTSIHRTESRHIH